ncbi:MAG TPA: STAS domain-containing protein [Sedimentisphaerales bacterium]|nr:STAS domain-containing protein [Sedimentisphaerales bacterium]
MVVESVKFVESSRVSASSGLAEVIQSMAEPVDMEITTEANAAIIAFKSPSMSDVDGIAAAATKIKEFVKTNRPRTLVFDFGAVRFFSSLVLGLLLDVRQNLATYGGEAVVSGINPQLHRVFKITNLNKVFRFFASRQDAVEAANAD